jgi:hypothetical protein
MFVSLDKKLIILFPPKTASTSIQSAMNKTGIKFNFGKKKLEYPIFHLNLSELCDCHVLTNIEDYTSIQFTRNPYYRFISSYYQLIRISPNNEKITFHGMNFKEFVFHIDKCKSSENFIENFFGDDSHYYENLRTKKSWSGVRMFDEQIAHNDLGVKIHYFKIEDLSNNLKIVSNLISSEIGPVYNLKRNPIEINYDNLLDSESKEIIYKNFISDFKVLGYDR